MKRRDFLNTVPLVAAAAATSIGATAGADESGGKSPAATVSEPARQTPVVHECDLCVIGGSCTGVFAAVAAARLGAKVALIESNGFFGANCSDADELTRAELEGRRQVRAICDLLREHFMDGKGVPLAWLPAKIGIRETRHARCVHRLTVDEILSGKRFPDAIGNGTYPVDIHSADGAGVTFRHLKDAPFYQIPFSSLVPRGAKNVLVAGRCLDADEGAFGAVRVMVNCNQMGQAAGAAAWLALDSSKDVDKLDTTKLRATLKKQGAIVL
jgi:hypothetical protein